MTFLAVEFDTGNTGSFDPDDTMATHVGIDTSAQGSLARVKVPRFNGSVTTIGQPGPGIDLRYVWIEYDGPTDTLEVYFAATDQQPATPTVSAQVDLDQLFGGVTDLWTGWTAGTGSAVQRARRPQLRPDHGGRPTGIGCGPHRSDASRRSAAVGSERAGDSRTERGGRG